MFQAIHLTLHFCLAERGVHLLSDLACHHARNKCQHWHRRAQNEDEN